MSLYTKKPVTVEAEQYNGEVVTGVCTLEGCPDQQEGKHHVHTIHDNQSVQLENGDYILPEPDGEHFYPVKPDIFAATYAPATAYTYTDVNENMARRVYDTYNDAVGGVNWNGDKLPTSAEFFADETKDKQANAWRAATLECTALLFQSAYPTEEDNAGELRIKVLNYLGLPNN